ncbi:FAD-binding protein [Bacillus piscicola]|uniref:FAD-binding protein n=1 Tax=Bacillus piscicola TaxID=1632684 RepID=UPI001F099C63|nr:FAD-binding protein [Bacillus piscicola]
MEVYYSDILCIGSGVAGLMSSIAAAELNRKICIVSKEPFSWGNTRISGGVIASNQGPSFFDDILKSGEELNSTKLVETLLQESDNIHDTLEDWGHVYQRDGKHKNKIKPGGHTEARTYVSSYKGISLGNILRMRLLKEDNVQVLEETAVCQILVEGNRAYGAMCFNWVKNEWSVIYASQIILASGGGGMLYAPHTDNMRSSTGDSYALALQAGASLVDMEQVQFIPFGIAEPVGMVGIEVGDTAAAGPYGVLTNDNGEVFLDDIPNQTREAVSRKIALQMSGGTADFRNTVWLDPSANTKEVAGRKAWENAKQAGSLEGLKYAYGAKSYKWKEPFKVVPTLHYIMGGVIVDHDGNTTVDGLMAAGEAVGGVHGAGRMGSMSLFEGLVFGRLVGHRAAEKVTGKRDQCVSKLVLQSFIDNYKKSLSNEKGVYSPFKLKDELSSVMWQYAGLIREEKGLRIALDKVIQIERKAQSLNIDWCNSAYRQVILNTIELKSMLVTAKSIIISALKRTESRGSHFRLDYPNESTLGLYNVRVNTSRDEMNAQIVYK